MAGPGGAVTRLRPEVAPSPGSYQPPPACMSKRHRQQSHHPACMSVRHQRPWAKSPPCCMSVWHRRPWAMSTLKYRTEPRAQKNWLGAFTAKSRAHGSISAAAAGRPDSYNSEKLQHNFMCRASSTAVDDSRWHGEEVGSSLTACTLTSRFCAHRILLHPGPQPGALFSLCAKRASAAGLQGSDHAATGPVRAGP